MAKWFSSIIEYANSHGIEFGLWFEGEMVQENSDTYRAHPDWILQEEGRIPVEGRRQQVLDLTNPDAYAHVLNKVSAILANNKISYIKWDHNRHLTDPVSQGRAAVRNQTLAIYRLFDELKERHPGLEIESCASGGGRIDLGMIEHADRFWTSDMNDPHERQDIQRWTSLVIPPEVLGTHVGPTVGHQLHRTHDIHFRAVSALFGHAGIEWNINDATERELEVLKNFADFYKAHRSLLHSGNPVRSDLMSSDANFYGTVSQDKSEAIFSYLQIHSIDDHQPTIAYFYGLDSSTIYNVQIIESLSANDFMQKREPGWWPQVALSGEILREFGLQLPIIRPEEALLFHVKKVS